MRPSELAAMVRLATRAHLALGWLQLLALTRMTAPYTHCRSASELQQMLHCAHVQVLIADSAT